jgi:broad specificity phosphatase PhoE
MAVICLIRHGQTGFGPDRDYERLTPAGQRQCRALGLYLQRAWSPLDSIYSGTLGRHAMSTAVVHTALGAAAPDPVQRREFDEYDYRALVRAYLPAFLEYAQPGQPVGEAELFANPRLFELAFRYIVKCWMNADPYDGQLETWREFCARVESGLTELVNGHGPNARIAVVTSAGVTAAALRTVLGLSNKRTLGVNWTIYNASVTQLYYGKSDRHQDALLLGFNNVVHLELAGGRELVTFR